MLCSDHSLPVSIFFPDTSYPGFTGMALLVPSLLSAIPACVSGLLSILRSSSFFLQCDFSLQKQPHEPRSRLGDIIIPLVSARCQRHLVIRSFTSTNCLKSPHLGFNTNDRDCCAVRGKQTWCSGILPGSVESPICCPGLSPSYFL